MIWFLDQIIDPRSHHDLTFNHDLIFFRSDYPSSDNNISYIYEFKKIYVIPTYNRYQVGRCTCKNAEQLFCIRQKCMCKNVFSKNALSQNAILVLQNAELRFHSQSLKPLQEMAYMLCRKVSFSLRYCGKGAIQVLRYGFLPRF